MENLLAGADQQPPAGLLLGLVHPGERGWLVPEREHLVGRIGDAHILAEVGSEDGRIRSSEVATPIRQSLLDPGGAAAPGGALLAALQLDPVGLPDLGRREEAPGHVPGLIVPRSWAPLTPHLDGVEDLDGQVPLPLGVSALRPERLPLFIELELAVPVEADLATILLGHVDLFDLFFVQPLQVLFSGLPGEVNEVALVEVDGALQVDGPGRDEPGARPVPHLGHLHFPPLRLEDHVLGGGQHRVDAVGTRDEGDDRRVLVHPGVGDDEPRQELIEDRPLPPLLLLGRHPLRDVYEAPDPGVEDGPLLARQHPDVLFDLPVPPAEDVVLDVPVVDRPRDALAVALVWLAMAFVVLCPDVGDRVEVERLATWADAG